MSMMCIVHCALCNAKSQKRSTRGQLMKEDESALLVYLLVSLSQEGL